MLSVYSNKAKKPKIIKYLCYNSSSSNLTINGVITLNYSDATGDKDETLNVTANYVAMPVVTGGLTVSSPSLFNQSLVLDVTESQSFAIALTNTTSATNNGTESISIPYASLMPSNGGGVTYSINTTGITTNPCTLPSVGNSMTLAADATCNYHLVITAGSSEVSDTAHSLSTDYNYNNYTSNSTTPSLSGSGNVTNVFNLEVTAVAELIIELASPGDINNFDGIEQGLSPDPTLDLVITNNGAGAVIGAVSATLPSGITGDFSSCTDLAVDASCDVTLTMSTTSTIVSANLNTVVLNYNNGDIDTTADFPSISYSVDAVNTPAISMVATVTGCVDGNGTSTTCMNNPDDMGGNASSMKVRLTFTNSSVHTAATSLSLQSAESGLFTTAGYTVNSNNCGNGVAANNGTCVIEYDMPSSASTSAIEPDITDSTFTYDYAYTTPQGQNLDGNSSSNLSIDIDVVNPALAIGAIADIPKGNTGSVSITVSSLYQANAPSISLSATKADSNPPVGMDFGTVTCGSLSSHGRTCSGSIITSSTTDIADGYVLTATAYGGLVTGSATFNVGPPPLVIFMTAGKWNGNLGGFAGADAKCNDDTSKPALPAGATYKALLAGNNATVTSRKYYQTNRTTLIATATGGDLVGSAPLDNAINPGIAAWPWTGSVNKCGNWDDATSASRGTYGVAGLKTSGWWGNPDIPGNPCNQTANLFCVQQPND